MIKRIRMTATCSGNDGRNTLIKPDPTQPQSSAHTDARVNSFGQPDQDDGSPTFHKFNQFPAELQNMVWKDAACSLPTPEIYRFDFDVAYDLSSENGLRAYFKPVHAAEQTKGHRGLLMACQDSRMAFFSHADFVMFPFTYFAPAIEDKGEKVIRQGLIPFNTSKSYLLIDKVARPMSYEAVDPAQLKEPKLPRAFAQMAGLKFLHSLKKFGFIMADLEWELHFLFFHFFATTPRHYTDREPITMGLDKVALVSRDAVENQSHMSETEFRKQFTEMNLGASQTHASWNLRDLTRMHNQLHGAWARKQDDNKRRWQRKILKKN